MASRPRRPMRPSVSWRSRYARGLPGQTRRTPRRTGRRDRPGDEGLDREPRLDGRQRKGRPRSPSSARFVRLRAFPIRFGTYEYDVSAATSPSSAGRGGVEFTPRGSRSPRKAVRSRASGRCERVPGRRPTTQPSHPVLQAGSLKPPLSTRRTVAANPRDSASCFGNELTPRVRRSGGRPVRRDGSLRAGGSKETSASRRPGQGVAGEYATFEASAKKFRLRPDHASAEKHRRTGRVKDGDSRALSRAPAQWTRPATYPWPTGFSSRSAVLPGGRPGVVRRVRRPRPSAGSRRFPARARQVSGHTARLRTMRSCQPRSSDVHRATPLRPDGTAPCGTRVTGGDPTPCRTRHAVWVSARMIRVRTNRRDLVRAARLEMRGPGSRRARPPSSVIMASDVANAIGILDDDGDDVPSEVKPRLEPLPDGGMHGAMRRSPSELATRDGLEPSRHSPRAEPGTRSSAAANPRRANYRCRRRGRTVDPVAACVSRWFGGGSD